MRPSVRVPTPVTRFPGPVPGTCFAGPRSPRSPSLAPPAPQRIALLCSSASCYYDGSVFSGSCIIGYVPRLPDRSSLILPRSNPRPLGSRAKSFHTARVSTTPGRVALATTRPSMLPSVTTNTSAPGTFKLSWLYGWPMRCPADASSSPSRMPTHGSGPMRIATPSLQWTCTTYSLPVSTGAPFFLNFVPKSQDRLTDNGAVRFRLTMAGSGAVPPQEEWLRHPYM